jgi:hypothetical protein
MASPRRPTARGGDAARTPAEFFAGHPTGLAVFDRVLAIVRSHGPAAVRVSKSQVAFRRRRGFAWLWLPERYLGARSAGIVVLSFALGRQEASARLKEVVQVAPAHWMHHLEIRAVAEVDDVVAAWLREAADRAG